MPTTTFLAEVMLADGVALRGRLFVPNDAPQHPGPMRPEERLNDESDFFPFLVAGEHTPILVNKRQVAWVTVDTRAVYEHPDAGEAPGAHESLVWVDCCGRRLEGVLLIELPAYKSRVLDYLNQAVSFVRLRSATWLHYVRRDRITKVGEVAP